MHKVILLSTNLHKRKTMKMKHIGSIFHVMNFSQKATNCSQSGSIVQASLVIFRESILYGCKPDRQDFPTEGTVHPKLKIPSLSSHHANEKLGMVS